MFTFMPHIMAKFTKYIVRTFLVENPDTGQKYSFCNSGHTRSGQVKSGHVKSGQIQSGQDKSRQVKSEQVRTGRVRIG